MPSTRNDFEILCCARKGKRKANTAIARWEAKLFDRGEYSSITNIYCSATKYTDPTVDPLIREGSSRRTDCNRLVSSLLRSCSDRLLHKAGSGADLPAVEDGHRVRQPPGCLSFLRRTAQRMLPAVVQLL